jgi:predicted nuclease of predicted toxin-antitoxin system
LTRLLLDQGLPHSTLKQLDIPSWDVQYVSDIGLSRATNRDILHAARNDSRTIVTLDADFHTILALDSAASPSVIRIRREGLKGRELAELLFAVWPKIEKDILQGAMITVTESSVRIHNSPVSRKHQGS